jgi:hypothetical protein
MIASGNTRSIEYVRTKTFELPPDANVDQFVLVGGEHGETKSFCRSGAAQSNGFVIQRIARAQSDDRNASLYRAGGNAYPCGYFGGVTARRAAMNALTIGDW